MKLIEAENLKSSPGISTGWSALDSFVASGGFPCGEISLIEAREGLGATTLWLEAAAKQTAQHSRVAWLNSPLDEREAFQLHPPTAFQRGVDLRKLFLVDTPTSRSRLWILQELLNSKLFSLVGCDLGDVHLPLRECRSLLMQARRSGAAVVLFDRKQRSSLGRSVASLVLKFENPHVELIRAAHRPTPQCLTTQQRRTRHVDFITGSASAVGFVRTNTRSGY